MARLLFVVHRAPPFPGGSEYYVGDMSREASKRGHDVTILAHEHQGNYYNIPVTNDYNDTLNQKWDLILVHGGDVVSQNIIHYNAYQLNKHSPVAYMIIKPSTSEICLNGLKHHTYLCYSTSADIEHIWKHGDIRKARRIRHGIVPEITIKEKKLADTPTFVSAGGFYPHKAMVELANAWQKFANNDWHLHMYGYGEGPRPIEADNIHVHFGLSKDVVLQAIANAHGYIMNSYEEGFGLVLLEAMMNRTPWFARNIAGARDMAEYGNIYEREDQLIERNFFRRAAMLDNIDTDIEKAYNYAIAEHSIVSTVNDIEDIVEERR